METERIYDSRGYDQDGFDRNGYDIYGYDADGYDKSGFDRKGFDREGLNRFGKTKLGLSPSERLSEKEMALLEKYWARTIAVYQIPKGMLTVSLSKALLYINPDAYIDLPDEILQHSEIKDTILQVAPSKAYMIYNIDDGRTHPLCDRKYLPRDRKPQKDEEIPPLWDGLYGKKDSSAYNGASGDLAEQISYILDHQ